MTWLGEICKIFRDLVERIHKYEVKILLKMANFEDFPSIFCLTAVLFAIGGGSKVLVKYSPVVVALVIYCQPKSKFQNLRLDILDLDFKA